MNQTELNLYFVQAILYYCNEINQGSHYFDTWALDCGTWTYDNDNNLIVNDWLLNNETYNIPQPTNATLLTYTATQVLDFHQQYYLFVNDIYNANQGTYYFASSSQLNSIQPTRLVSCDGYRAFDTTIKRVVFWNNTAQEWQQS